MDEINRRDFLHGALAGAATLAVGQRAFAQPPSQQSAVVAQIAKQHGATLKMLQDWIAIPSIAAENIGYPRGAEYMAQLARAAGFQRVDIIPTSGKPASSPRMMPARARR
jgi:hypothetical protein